MERPKVNLRQGQPRAFTSLNPSLLKDLYRDVLGLLHKTDSGLFLTYPTYMAPCWGDPIRISP